MNFDLFDVQEAEGVIIAHTLHLQGRTIKKGTALSSEDLTCLLNADIKQISGAQLQNEDIGEDEAATLIAQALAGNNFNLSSPMGGRVNLYAKTNGIAVIDKNRIDAINLCQTDIAVATLPQYAEAHTQQAVASVKVIPFGVPKKLVDQCITLAKTDDQSVAVGLNTYRPSKVALILTCAPGLKSSTLDATREVTRQRLKTMDSYIPFEARCAHSLDAITQTLHRALASDCSLILICGATVTVDTGDIIPTAIINSGGNIVHYGMPVEPGNMLLLARIGDRHIINLPGCSRSPKLNGLDWVLQRLTANIPITARDIQMMGVGGLIKDIPLMLHRKKAPKLTKTARSRPQVAALILAAGQSRRMGKQNKLLANIDGTPMISHVVRAAIESNAQQIIVVVGHDAEHVQKAISDYNVKVIFNPNYASGMASSLKAALNAVEKKADGAMILLGDMPLVTADQINEMMSEFNPSIERDIVAPL